MRAEVRKSIEFSLPQAQVFYISSRNKFILVKNNKSFAFSFYAQLYSNLVPQLFRSPPDPAWQRKQLLPHGDSAMMLRTAANHVEEHFDDHSDDKIQQIWDKYSIEKKCRFLTKKLTRFLQVKDKFPNISSVTLRWGHNKVARVLHVFRSNFWLAHRTMLKLGREV